MTTIPKLPGLTPEKHAALDAHWQARQPIDLNDGVAATFDGEELILVMSGEGYHAPGRHR